jgi:hypothetical protein
MKLELEIHKYYNIDDKILKEYIEDCKENNTAENFDDFVQNFLDFYYLGDDFLEEEDEFWNTVNNSFQVSAEFSKEIKRLKND